VSEQLKRMPGVADAEAAVGGPLRVEFDRQVTSEKDIRAVLDGLGVQTRSENAGEHDHVTSHAGGRPAGKGHEGHDHRPGAGHDHGGVFGESTELIYSLLCGALLAAGFLIETFSSAPSWLPMAGYLGAYFFGGFYTLREAISNIRLGRFEIDTLMLVAAAGA